MKFQTELPPLARAVREPVDWAKAKAEMVAHEGEWGLIATNVASSTPSQLRRGEYKDFRGDELRHFEFATRKPEDVEVAKTYPARRSDLWGRYTAKVAKVAKVKR